MEKEKAIIQKDSNDHYHNVMTDYIGSSTLKLYKRSPLHVIGMEKEETASMFIGTAYHMFILESDEFSNTYYIFDEMARPEKDKTMMSNINKAWKAEIYERYQGKILTKETYGQFKAMKKLLFSHQYAKYLLTQGESELSHYVDFNGILCKFRPDKINIEKRLIVDLKTTSDASKDKYFRHAYDMGYHISGAFYCDLAEYVYTPGELWTFILIVQEVAPPFAFAIYKATFDFMRTGRYEYQACLDQHEYCKLTGIYKGYEVFANNKYGIQDINIPGYLHKDIIFYNDL